MKPAHNKRKLQRWQILAIALFTAWGVTMAVVFIVNLGNSGTPSNPITGEPIPTASKEAHVPGELQQFEDTFGPFAAITVDLDVDQSDTKPPAILLFADNGGTRASTQYTISSDPHYWKEQSYLDSAASITMEHGFAVIRTKASSTLKVQAEQPFALENAPDRLYRITKDRKVLTIRAAIASGLRQDLPSPNEQENN